MNKLDILIVMDPVETININLDTTFALALAAQERDFSVWIAYQDQLIIDHAQPVCITRQVIFKNQNPCFEWISENQRKPLDDFNTILMRKDPPFDEKFFFATHILSLCQEAKVVNRPESLRNAPEKIYGLNFPQINPPSIVTSNSVEIKSFLMDSPKGVIVKPLNQCGGAGIIYLSKQDKNFNSLIELSTKNGSEYIIVQHYLPEIVNGDKRVICVNGDPLGAILRVPDPEEHRGNIHVGAKVKRVELTKRDRWLMDQIRDKLVQDGLYFVGLDIIGDYITEINVTSPTGIQEILKLGGKDIAKYFWDNISTFS
jgi:glutathione synthase